MNCDGIAPFYVWLERAAFGRRLERHRAAFLTAAGGATRALVLGDGDGRFLSRLTAAYPDLSIDCIDLSARMLSLASRRLPPSSRARVHFLHGNALTVDFPANSYDIVYSHFFLDCFTSDEVLALSSKISSMSHPRSIWVISDFEQASGGWRRLYTAAWIKAMYAFFRLTTQLQTRQLPNHREALKAAGFRLMAEYRGMAGLVTSQLWERNDPAEVSHPALHPDRLPLQ